MRIIRGIFNIQACNPILVVPPNVMINHKKGYGIFNGFYFNYICQSFWIKESMVKSTIHMRMDGVKCFVKKIYYTYEQWWS